MLKELIPVRGRDLDEGDSFLALREQMDRVFDDWFNVDLLPGARERAFFSPRVDLTQTDDAIRVAVELPGIDRKDVEVELLPGRLVVSGKKESDVETRKEKFVRRERYFGSFRREIALPAPVEEAGAKASFEKGVLTVTLPASETRTLMGRKIEVR